MAQLSNSSDYRIFLANMEHVVVNETSIELVHQDAKLTCMDCGGSCIFNDYTSSCEYSEDYHPEIYYKLLNYIQTYHPEKLI